MSDNTILDDLIPDDVMKGFKGSSVWWFTSDMVHVVRCRDCKYYAIAKLTRSYEPDKRCKRSVCIKGQYAVRRNPDWFCADGERRNDDGNGNDT